MQLAYYFCNDPFYDQDVMRPWVMQGSAYKAFRALCDHEREQPKVETAKGRVNQRNRIHSMTYVRSLQSAVIITMIHAV